MIRILALLLLAATGVQEGANYQDEDLDAKAPGPRWRLQTAVPDAPSLRGAYVLPRTDGGKDRSSLITFAYDAEPGMPLQAYVDAGMKELQAAPLSFRMKKRGPFKSKGRDAYRADYTDRDGIRHFAQIALQTPSGGIVVSVLQSPDAQAFGEDMPVFLAFVERLTPTGAAAKPAAPAPAKPKSKSKSK